MKKLTRLQIVAGILSLIVIVCVFASNVQAGMALAFTIPLVANLKAKGLKMDEDQEKFFTELETAINSEMSKYLSGMLKADDLTQKLEDFKKGLGANISAEKATEIDQMIEAVKKHAAEIQKFKDRGIKADGGVKTLKSVLDENMPEIEKLFRSRSSKEEIKITLKAAGIMTSTNVIDSDTNGITEEDYTGTFRVDAFVPKRREGQYIFDIADRTTSDEVPEVIIWWEEGDGEGAVAIVAEGAVKPLVDLALVENISRYKKAAGKIVVTEEFAKFKKRAYTLIRGLFNDKVLRDYQDILTTNLLASAASYIGTTLDGTIAVPNDFHAIGAVAAQLETLNYTPDTLIINPQDKWRMALSQDENGNFYSNVLVQGANGQMQIMSFRTVTTSKIAAGTFILGQGDVWKIEDEAVTMRMGYGVTMNGATAESDFDHNRFRIIGELYFHNYIASNNSGGFVQATFAAVKAALLEPAV